MCGVCVGCARVRCHDDIYRAPKYTVRLPPRSAPDGPTRHDRTAVEPVAFSRKEYAAPPRGRGDVVPIIRSTRATLRTVPHGTTRLEGQGLLAKRPPTSHPPTHPPPRRLPKGRARCGLPPLLAKRANSGSAARAPRPPEAPPTLRSPQRTGALAPAAPSLACAARHAWPEHVERHYAQLPHAPQFHALLPPRYLNVTTGPSGSN